MATNKQNNGQSPQVKPFDIFLLSLLALVWGTVFAFWKITLETIPPVTTAAIRVSIAALFLWLYLQITGRKLPRSGKQWAYIFATSGAGLVIPFSIIGWGQQHIDTAIAAICMASVPLYTLPLAHFFTSDEKLTGQKLIGMLTGFGGVVLLFASRSGADADTGSSELLAVLGIIAVLIGAFSYAVEGLLIRKMGDHEAGPLDGIVLSTSLLIAASITLLPICFILEDPSSIEPSLSSSLTLLYLGLGGSALAMVLMVTLIQRVGATITSLNNYLVPLIGVFTGILWMNETLLPTDVLSCALILIGIGVTSWKRKVT